MPGMKGGDALYIEEDVYLTFYLWHTETRNFKKWSHDNAAVDVHGCVVYSHHCICMVSYGCMVWHIYTYRRGPLQLLILDQRQLRGPVCGISDRCSSRAFFIIWPPNQKYGKRNRPVRELRTYINNVIMKAAKCLLTLMLAGVFTAASAQISKEQIKERREMAKASKAELNEKASKTSRKEAKKLEKEGWQSAPGALPLVKQLDRSYMMQMEYDEDMYPKYLMGEAISIAENYDAAKMQALELAKQNLAGQIQTEITALVENTVSNKQLAAEQAASVTQSIMAAKNLISQSIGRTITVMELYRVKPNKNKEVLVRIAYNGNMAKAAAKKAVYEQLEEKGDGLHQKLDELLGW